MSRPERMTAAEYRARHVRAESSDLALSRPPQKIRAHPVTADGIRHASKHEKRVYEHLRFLYRGAILLRGVRWDLPCIGQGETWKPDFTILEPLGPLFRVAVHEAKGSKAGESRDFRLRLKAFLVSYPSVTVTVWRRPHGRGALESELQVGPRTPEKTT